MVLSSKFAQKEFDYSFLLECINRNYKEIIFDKPEDTDLPMMSKNDFIKKMKEVYNKNSGLISIDFDEELDENLCVIIFSVKQDERIADAYESQLSLLIALTKNKKQITKDLIILNQKVDLINYLNSIIVNEDHEFGHFAKFPTVFKNYNNYFLKLFSSEIYSFFTDGLTLPNQSIEDEKDFNVSDNNVLRLLRKKE